MCGIVAVCTSRAPDRFAEVVDSMNATLVHRGPDEGGSVVSTPDGIALAMRRLSVVDIEGGAQPMWDSERRRCVVFNGEIYNAAELRSDLSRRGRRFRSDHSDTEVLVEGFAEWGTALVPRLNGMFAFALWDRPNARLVVARDRTGEKPLYVARVPGGYAVASELKALLRYPGLSFELDPAALGEYLAFDYVLPPRTLLQAVDKLPAGHVGILTSGDYQAVSYWTPRFWESRAGEDELLAEFDDLLASSVRMRMVADVPVGLLLSGGLDSTTVGHYMRRDGAEVRSFSIGFEESRFDESRFSTVAARHLGTDHHLEVLSEARARELVSRVPELLDEPMGDPSVLPTHLLSLVARSEVTVALGGDGSDELLMGYDAYRLLDLSWRLARIPRLGAAVTELAHRVPAAVNGRSVPGVRFLRGPEESTPPRLLRYLGAFKGDPRAVLAPELRRAFDTAVVPSLEARLLADLPGDLTPAHQAVATYLRAYLQEDILVKIDRASMAASLEVRAPFLDPRLIDFLLGVPTDLKLRWRRPKHLLRRLMRGRIPAAVMDRRKQGFDVPLDAWMRGALAPVLSEYLDPARLAHDGLLDPAAVQQLVAEHMAGREQVGRRLWLLLQLELWRERWLR